MTIDHIVLVIGLFVILGTSFLNMALLEKRVRKLEDANKKQKDAR